MRTEKIIKIAGLNIGIAVINTIIFSPGFLGIQIGGTSIFKTAFGITVILMSFLIFIYGNYNLLMKKDKTIQASEVKTEEDYVSALKQNYDKKTFEKDIDNILEQIKRLKSKKDTIKDILLQRFNSSEMSYSKFEGTILDIENLFYINIKSMINKLNAFDEAEYMLIKKGDAQRKFSAEVLQTKTSIYNDYISFIKNAIEDNEEIILKLDRLLLELTKLNSLEDGQIEEMSAMKDIDDLINKTKLYK
jgi:hypothetical protein